MWQGVNTGLCSNTQLNQGGRASLRQDVHSRLWECLRRATPVGGGEWMRAGEQNMATVMEDHPFNYRKFFVMSL